MPVVSLFENPSGSFPARCVPKDPPDGFLFNVQFWCMISSTLKLILLIGKVNLLPFSEGGCRKIHWEMDVAVIKETYQTGFQNDLPGISQSSGLVNGILNQ